MEALLAICVILGLIAIMLAYSAFAWGCVTFQFYYWFVLPVFTNLPMITLGQAIGLSLFISLFKNHGSSNPVDEKFEWSKTLLALLTPWLVLIIGYFIKQTLV